MKARVRSEPTNANLWKNTWHDTRAKGRRDQQLKIDAHLPRSHHIRIMKQSILFGLIAFLGACSASHISTTVRNTEHYPLYSPEIVRWAVAGRDLPLDLILQVAPEHQESWQLAAGAALSQVSSLQAGRVTAWPDDSQRGNFHLAVVVNAPLGLTARHACSRRVDPAHLVPQNGETHLLFAFCNEQRPVSTARAVVAAISASDDPQFISGLRGAATQALPRERP